MGNMVLRLDNIVEKRNMLNEMRSTQLNLVELRFLTIYLSKINARDISTRKVRFPLADFLKIMKIQKVNISALKMTAYRILSHVVSIPNKNTGGFTVFQLFKECKVDKDENGNWFVDIDAHDKALPLMFEFKQEYFKYELWNALRLKSSNQIRMYEILKQYEHKGERTITIEDLRAMIGIEKGSYPMYADFRKYVIDKAQAALKESTDISFTYKPIRKAKGKVSALCFAIKKNADYVDQFTLADFIDLQAAVEDENVIGEAFELADHENEKNISALDEAFVFLSESFKAEFTDAQVEVLYRVALPYIQYIHPGSNYNDVLLKMYDYFLLKYAQLNAYNKPVKSRFGLLRTIIEADVKALS